MKETNKSCDNKKPEVKLGDIPTVSVSVSFHLYVVVCPDSAVHHVKE